MRKLFAAIIPAMIVLCLGCARGYEDKLAATLVPAKGKVTYQGKPLPNAVVTLHPVDKLAGGGASATELVRTPFGIAKDDGSFELTTIKPADGAPEGEYAVTVSWTGEKAPKSDNDAAPERLPAKFQNPVASGIRVQVRSGQELPEIRLN
ncbi:MAG: hypothetical protein U0939_10015 [Pirellulales bacterium]